MNAESERLCYGDQRISARAQGESSSKALAYEFLDRTGFLETHSWSSLLVRSSRNDHLKFDHIIAYTEGITVYRLQLASGWWVEVREELPFRYASMEEAETGFIQKFRKHQEDPFTFSLQSQDGLSISRTLPWMESTKETFVETLKSSPQVESLLENVPKIVVRVLQDLDEIAQSSNHGSIESARYLAERLLPVLENADKKETSKPWEVTSTQAVGHSDCLLPLSYEASRFLSDFPLVDEESYHEMPDYTARQPEGG